MKSRARKALAWYEARHRISPSARRKPSIDPSKIRQMKAEGMGPSAIAKALKIGRASVYRALTG
jgi:DNA invertase Pin-like site-specific DNA recombinase